ncbi:MAG: hypothetical protein PVG81_06820 [Desulfobacterales bacterium]|jgi:hypothetical protein
MPNKLSRHPEAATISAAWPAAASLRARLKITDHLGADASLPDTGVKSCNIKIFLRFYVLSAGRLNAQNQQLIFSRALRTTTNQTLDPTERWH